MSEKDPSLTQGRPPKGAAAANPSRDSVKADRGAAKEAKRAAKEAAKAKKAASGSGGATSTGAQGGDNAAGGSLGTGASSASTSGLATGPGPSSLPRGQPAQAGQNRQDGNATSSAGGGRRPTSSAGTRNSAATSSNLDGLAQVKEQQQQLRPSATPATPSVLGGISLFGNVATSKSHSQLTPHLIGATYRSQVHPSVLALAQQLSTFSIVGADARAISVLRALRDFITDYRISQGAVFNRELVTKLGPQISFLVTARPLGASVGHAIRFLKYEISVIPVELSEAEAKERILSRIDHFVRDRITYATRVISYTVGGTKIKDGDVVLTFARSSVVQQTLLEAWKKGKRFEVIVVDARPLCEGRKLLTELVAAGIPCTYGLLTSLSSLVSRASLVLLGTASLLANGALYSRAGTAPCAMMAREKGVPVIVCCETYKFSERIQLDSFVVNEAGDPRDILSKESSGSKSSSSVDSLISISEWEKNAALGAVNLLYDLTPPRYVTAVASEVGLNGPESVGVILRDYKSVLYGQ